MSLSFTLSLDRLDWEWRPKWFRSPWLFVAAWLCFYVRVSR